jgi:hypothetical protein
MRRNQGSVFWIGGGCGAGKSSVAHAISRRFDLQLYAADAHGYTHLSRLTGSERPASSHDERWLEPSAEELAEGFLRASAEKFPLVRFRTVIAAEGQPLIGIALLRRSRLSVEALPGGEVTVSEL